MKFLALADIHLKNWNDKVQTEEGIPLKLKECLQVIHAGCKLCNERKISDIIIAGDLNDTKGIANVDSFARFKDIIEEFDKINFHIIPGNHDATLKSSRKWAVELVKGPSNVFIYTEPTVVDDITFIPWSHEDLVENIFESEPNNVLISHFGLNEAHLSSGISLKTGIKASHLKKFKISILGHYHCPQQLDNIYYVGSPIPYRRDEIKDEKRYLIVDSEELTVESIPTVGYRKYVEYIINEDSNMEEIAEEINNLKISGDFIVIRNEMANVPEELKEVISENKNIQVVDKFEKDYSLRGITSGMTLTEQMEKYSQLKNMDPEEIIKFIEVGLKYLNREKIDE